MHRSPLYYSVRVTAENEHGDRRTYDASEWNDLSTTTSGVLGTLGRVLAVQLYRDGFTTILRTAIRAVTPR